MTNFEKQKQERISLASQQQRQASNPKSSVWVEASAGTGKTKVLSDRVLRLLLNDCNPSRILCLTYTKAAAVEMSNRINSKLSCWATISDDELKKELEKLLGTNTLNHEKSDKLIKQARRLFAILLDTPGGIKIQTIHSFCQTILKQFPLEAKISPYFEIMDDRNSMEILESIKSEILQGKIDSKTSQALAYLTSTVSEFRFPSIVQSIIDNRNTIDEYIQKHQTLDNLILSTSKKLKVGTSETQETIENEFWKQTSPDYISIIVDALNAGSDKSKETSIKLSSSFKQKDFKIFASVFLTEGQPRKTILVKKSKELYPQAEKIINDITEKLLHTLQKTTALNLLNSTISVLTIANEILSRYQQYKQHQSKMDYNDLIILTKKLLQSPNVADWILFKLDGGIDNILIDEAQDTSPEQWAIVKSLTEEFFSGLGNHQHQPTVFVVGDRKQSIYSFQGADPAEFENMHQYFNKKAPNFQTINMDVSFRSTAAILDTVNTVFNHSHAREGVAKPAQNITHVPSRIGDGGRVELWPLTEPDEDDVSNKIWLPPVERINNVSASAKLAKQIAETIKTKVSSGEQLKSKGCPLKYSDFLILVQRRNSFVDEMVRACKNIGVAITGVDKIKLLDQIAINDLIAIAQFALLPQDDLNLACVLKAPIFSLTDDDLFKLCYNRGEKTLWDNIYNNSSYYNTYITLYKIHELSKKSRPFEFFSYILNKLNGRQKFISRLGFECEDAIDEFINLCIEYEKEHIPSLQLFIDWILKDNAEIKRNLEQNDSNAVRLMTVHGSKGLQAPVVILPDTVRIKNIRQEAGWIKDKDNLFYPLGKDSFEQLCCKLKEEEKALSFEEYHRLLYVALTRAEECLCICGYKNKNKPSDDSWYELCRQAFSTIAQTLPDEKLVYDVEQKIIPPSFDLDSNVIKDANSSHPWLQTNPQKWDPLSRPLTPSHQDEKQISAISPLKQNINEKIYSRGRLIHKLLQFLPNFSSEKHSRIISDFLNNQAQDFSPIEKEKIKDEILSLTTNYKFSPLFSEDSIAEVSLMGQVDNQIISGQIDRLVVTPTKVMIVDYKTNRPAAKTVDDVPLAYIKQLHAYKKLIAKIYQNKDVETYILWTNTATIMKIE